MTRLKIVDQNDIVLPFQFSHFGVSLAFNGEVYNWRELRAELSPAPWQTNCDAEVVAAAWHRWGPKMLEHFNGMWGMVLVDEQAGEIFIARDRAGLKPVFLAQRDACLYVASEIKALPIALEEQPCADLECFEYDFGEATPFASVRRLEPGCYLHLRGPEPTMPHRWWQLPSEPAENIGTFAQVVEETGALLIDSVRLRAVAEVPAALQLSGGLDSALIYACIKQVDPALAESIKLYCIDFAQDGIDNLSAAALAAGPGQAVQALTFGLPELEQAMPKIAYHLDTPATWSAVCLWFLAQQISADRNKIVLSGEGADELFGGYSRYRILWWLDRMTADPHLEAYAPTIKHLLGTQSGMVARMLDRSPRGAQLEHVYKLVRRWAPAAATRLRSATQTEFYTTMQVLLRMGDRMASAFGLENRCPFLDYRLMELGARLPDSYLIDEHESKRVLRAVARQLGVPAQITEEKTKKGLAIPWAKWSGATMGTRGAWDRSGFAELMRNAWRQSCIRAALSA